MKIVFAHTLIIALLVLAQPAHSVLNDKPYFNLWLGTDAAGKGDAPTLQMCGTMRCLTDPTSVTSADYAVFTALPKNTGRGSGNIDPFLRFQHQEDQKGNNPWEAAYNTDFRSNGGQNANHGQVQLDGDQFDPDPNPLLINNMAKDEKAGGPGRDTFNHTLSIGQLKEAASNGLVHFLLDINEPGNEKATLRIDELAIFVEDLDVDPTLDTTGMGKANLLTQEGDPLGGPTLSGGLGEVTKVWDMDFNKDLDSCEKQTSDPGDGEPNGCYGGLVLNNVGNGPAGSGDFDMDLALSLSLFTGFDDNDRVYLYNFMGEADSMYADEAESGFEEWALDFEPFDEPPDRVPEPTTILLIGTMLPGLMRFRKSKS